MFEAKQLAGHIGVGIGGAGMCGIAEVLLDYDLREREESLKGFAKPVGIVQFRP